MNSEQQISKDKPQMQLTCDVLLEEDAPSEENNFPQEQISFDFTLFGDQPIVTIEYDDSDNQPDPLAVDETAGITNLVSHANGKRKINVYHPFAQQVVELSELSLSSSPDSFYQCSPSKVTCSGVKRVELQNENSDQEEVVVVSDDDDVYVNLCPESGRKAVQSEAAGSQTEFPNDNRGEYVDENIQCKSLLVDQLGDVICMEDDPSNIAMKELAEQMLQKTEERKLAANHLKRKRLAETTFAKQLVRQMMKPESALVQSSPKSVDHVTQMTPKQQKVAESALARRLVQQMSKSCSLEEAIVALGSIAPSSRLTPANSINVANQANLSGKPVAGAPDKGTMKRGPPDRVEPQRMEAQPRGHVPCFASWPAKRLNQSVSKSNIQITMPRLEASSSNASTLQQALPPYAVAFNRPTRWNSKLSANESFPEGLGDQRFPMSNAFRSFLPHALPSYLPINAHRISPQCSNQHPPPRASERSPLSAVHPSHLMPPSSPITTSITIDDEAEDLIVPEVTNYFERINPPNVAQSLVSRYLEPSSSISRTPAESWHWNSPDIRNTQ